MSLAIEYNVFLIWLYAGVASTSLLPSFKLSILLRMFSSVLPLITCEYKKSPNLFKSKLPLLPSQPIPSNSSSYPILVNSFNKASLFLISLYISEASNLASSDSNAFQAANLWSKFLPVMKSKGTPQSKKSSVTNLVTWLPLVTSPVSLEGISAWIPMIEKGTFVIFFLATGVVSNSFSLLYKLTLFVLPTFLPESYTA